MTSVKNKNAPIEPLKKNKRTALGNLSNVSQHFLINKIKLLLNLTRALTGNNWTEQRQPREPKSDQRGQKVSIHWRVWPIGAQQEVRLDCEQERTQWFIKYSSFSQLNHSDYSWLASNLTTLILIELKPTSNSKENLSLIPKSKQLASKSEPKSSISSLQLNPTALLAY